MSDIIELRKLDDRLVRVNSAIETIEEELDGKEAFERGVLTHTLNILSLRRLDTMQRMEEIEKRGIRDVCPYCGMNILTIDESYYIYDKHLKLYQTIHKQCFERRKE